MDLHQIVVVLIHQGVCSDCSCSLRACCLCVVLKAFGTLKPKQSVFPCWVGNINSKFYYSNNPSLQRTSVKVQKKSTNIKSDICLTSFYFTTWVLFPYECCFSPFNNFHIPVLLSTRRIPKTTCVPMNAASAHQTLLRVITPPNLIIPTQTKFATHIAIIVNFQSRPPIEIPFTGYANPLSTVAII